MTNAAPKRYALVEICQHEQWDNIAVTDEEETYICNGCLEIKNVPAEEPKP